MQGDSCPFRASADQKRLIIWPESREDRGCLCSPSMILATVCTCVRLAECLYGLCHTDLRVHMCTCTLTGRFVVISLRSFSTDFCLFSPITHFLLNLILKFSSLPSRRFTETLSLTWENNSLLTGRNRKAEPKSCGRTCLLMAGRVKEEENMRQDRKRRSIDTRIIHAFRSVGPEVRGQVWTHYQRNQISEPVR